MAPPPSRDSAALTQRWKLIRDLSVFVVKATIETVRDLVLIPVAAAAGLLGLLFQPDDPGRYFRQLIGTGRRFDDWLNLFGTAERDTSGGVLTRAGSSLAGWADSKGGGSQPAGADALIARIEKTLVEEHRRGGITAQAKEAIDRTLDAIHRLPPRSSKPAGTDSDQDG